MTARGASFILAALVALPIALGCDRPSRPVEQAPAQIDAPVTLLRAPAGPDEPDLDLHHEWLAARVDQRVDTPRFEWPYRPFSEFVVLNGVGHRALLLLPSLDGEISRVSFKVDVPAESDDELVAAVALVSKFAPESDGVDVGWAIAAADVDPATVPLQRLRLAGGPPDAWREVRVDLAPHRGRTIWIVLASHDAKNRHNDWLLWGDPRVRAKRRAEPVVVDLAAPATLTRRPRAVPWDAATVFKSHALFGADGPYYGRPAWLREAFPWLASLRFLSSLGGNYGPTLAREDAERKTQPDFVPSFEVDIAGRYEFLRDGRGASPGPIEHQFDWHAFDALNASAASAGLDMTFNLAAAPERFTGGTGSYPTYRFNELPVTDESGWKTYVGALVRHLAEQPWYPRAWFSFFSEPNCVWVEQEGAVRKVGFQGDATQYARQYLWTWQAMAPALAGAPISLGPWVVETRRISPAAENLAEYLRALVDAFRAAGEPLPPWRAFSFNLYETPQLTLESFASEKIPVTRQILAAVLGRNDLPIRIEELGIHPLVSAAFEKATAVSLGTTRWEMAWHAEAAAQLLEAGIEQAASWFPVLMIYPPNQSLRAYASYLFASIVVGAVEWAATPDGTLSAVPRAADAATPSEVGIRLGGRHTDRIGVLTASEPGGRIHRLAVWSYPRFATLDGRPAESGAATEQVELALPPRADGAWRVRILAYADQSPLPADADIPVRTLRSAIFGGLPSFGLRELTASDRLRLSVEPGALYLLEADFVASK